ncbi:MAG: helix-turn-helix transcriptional regulator [Clostridia bacterium]|nr:helix-turn-helix transcriptional regulator [Clostridia bacterium]
MTERGITEKLLAEKIGVSQRCMHGYLNSHEHRRIPFKIFYGIMEALNVSLEEIIIINSPDDKKDGK